MNYSERFKWHIGLLIAAYTALIFHAFIPHHHHIDEHQFYVGSNSTCSGHSQVESSQTTSDDTDVDHSSAHLPGACSTIQHSLNTLSSSYDSEVLLKEVVSNFLWIGLMFENFVFEFPRLENINSFPIPKNVPNPDFLKSSRLLFRGPPSLIS